MNGKAPFQPEKYGDLPERIAFLIHGYNRKTLRESEHDELDDWVTTCLRNQKIFEELTDPVFLEKWVDWKDRLDPEAALQRVKKKLGMETELDVIQRRSYWPKFLVAAAVLSCIFFGIRWSLNNRQSEQAPVIAKTKDLLPGGKHAVLTLFDGTTIVLDTAKSGYIPSGAGTEIMKDSGSLSYSGTNIVSIQQRLNELKTPAGGEFQIRLSDGTKVWLNASSSLRYPETFTDSTRTVELTGEGYFEVAKDAAHPFIVSTGKDQIRVLGTHFNVDAYGDHAEIIVSLAEGSVRLNRTVVLKPGEEGIIKSTGIIQIGGADLETALAWKEGQFIFKMTPLETVMQQIAHWYDAKIVYQENNSEHFNARIPRDVPVSKLLHIMEATGQVHFKIEGRTITVLN